ncbi:hypothetical protein GHNINEIG_02251 [Hydrogenovibrio crunogenus]|uniref:Uncharacterized protein n=1 Tax=Hydrogenovibrio crunogenus TaxID=39765 RepID=A0A4P7P2C0_9GAMM|nr:hypothetical protein GHNINEIG_02251 [Hydrogenovibrio crunogenus]
MPVKPKPFKLMCEDCGWAQVYAPRSDAICAPLNECPKCGSKKINMKILNSSLSVFLNKLISKQ